VSAALASRADDNDTIDLAVLGGLKDDKALHGLQVTHFQPFDPWANALRRPSTRARIVVQGN